MDSIVRSRSRLIGNTPFGKYRFSPEGSLCHGVFWMVVFRRTYTEYTTFWRGTAAIFSASAGTSRSVTKKATLMGPCQRCRM